MFGADIGSVNLHFSVDMKKSYIEAQSSHHRQKMITLCISVLSFRNLAARGANVSSTLTLSFTQYDMLALSGDKAIIEGSIIPRILMILFRLDTVNVAVRANT